MTQTPREKGKRKTGLYKKFTIPVKTKIERKKERKKKKALKKTNAIFL